MLFSGVTPGSSSGSAQFDAKGALVNQQFGQITSARDPRIQQMSLRVRF